MSSDETILHLYRSLLNAVHNQYNRTLATMESIEQGMRQTITQNRSASSQDNRSTFSTQNVGNVPTMPSIFSRLAPPNINPNINLNQNSYSRNNMNNMGSSSSNSHNSRRSRNDIDTGSGTDGRSRNVRSRVRGRHSDNTDLSSSSQVEAENNDQPARTTNTTSTSTTTSDQPSIFRNLNAGNTQNPGLSNGFTFTSPSFSPFGGLTTVPPSTYSIVNEPTLTNLWNSFANGFENHLDHLSPVIVRPSEEEIDRATETLAFHEIENPSTLSCPISLEPLNHDDDILRIKFCGHYFLKEKIIPWFNSHVHCPLCRYDIREWRENSNNSDNASVSVSTDSQVVQEDQQRHGQNTMEEEEGGTSDNGNNDSNSSSLLEEERGSNVNRRLQTDPDNPDSSSSRENNTMPIPTLQDQGIQNILDILTNEVSNHMTSGATGDTLRIEVETHPIRLSRNAENEEYTESSNNNDNESN